MSAELVTCNLGICTYTTSPCGTNQIMSHGVTVV